MGGKQGLPKFEFGSVLITLQDNHFMAGQRVSGQVSYLCDKPFPAEKFYIELTGYQRLIWDGDDERHRSSKHPGKIYVKLNTLRITQVLVNFSEGKMVQGREIFPFTIQLPENLPSSVHYVDRNSYMRMEYKLTARMGVFSLQDSKKAKKSGNNGVELYQPLINKRLLVVSQPPERINFNLKLA